MSGVWVKISMEGENENGSDAAGYYQLSGGQINLQRMAVRTEFESGRNIPR